MNLPVIQPSQVTVMIKPVGALCNLNCHYCYYLPTTSLYGHREHRMKLDTLEATFASILPRFADEVTIAWQGGEPTLAGLDFFEKMIAFQNKYKRPGQRVVHSLQTNGTLLDDAWCQFLHRHNFLIGLSVDGPPRFHDHYRLTRRDDGSHDQVLRGFHLLQKHRVEHNLLTVLNDRNVKAPEEIYGYLYNLGCRFMQFIPAIEWQQNDDGHFELQPFSPTGEAYGEFLCKIFDIWFEKHRHEVSVRLFDVVLNRLVLGQSPLCIMDASCHGQLTIEHDGSVFGCDHFVSRRWQLAKIGDPGWQNPVAANNAQQIALDFEDRGVDETVMEDLHAIRGRAAGQRVQADTAMPEQDDLDTHWFERVESQRLGVFAARKQNLPPQCLSCQYKPFCYGGCPKHRPSRGEVPEPSTLCDGYLMFFQHAMPRLQWLASFLLRNEQPPPPPSQTMRSPSRHTGQDVRPAVRVNTKMSRKQRRAEERAQAKAAAKSRR